MRNKKTITLTEAKQDKLIESVLKEAFFPLSDVVVMVRDYLDKNFMRQSLDDISSDGYPIKTPTVMMVSADKQPLKTLQMKELLLLLDDKFNNLVKDEKDRKKFLKQVIKDWYYKKISKDGILSVNHL